MARFAPGANVLSRRRSIAWLAGAGAGLLHAPRVAFAADRVNIAISNSTADFAILIAMKRGYFAEEGIEANPTVFDSGGKMMAPLGAGDIDVATGSANATLYNAVARGIGIKVVCGNGNAARAEANRGRSSMAAHRAPQHVQRASEHTPAMHGGGGERRR